VPAEDSFDIFLERQRARIETALEHVLPRPPVCPPLVSDALTYAVTAGGKRLRPILTLTAADAVARRGEGAEPAQAMLLAMPAACAVELLHTYSLIHDDLPAMDNDTLRRGRPTLHVVYGDGIAVLAGDALQAEAFALLAREPWDDDPVTARRKLQVLQVVAEAVGAAGMVGGQAIDLQAAGQVTDHTLTLDDTGLQQMHLRKTGALIRASAASGAIMAGGDEKTVAAVDEWATQIGLAFQIVDDILDVRGTAGELGKTVGKDAAGAKPTYPSVFGLDRASTMADECRERARAILEDARLTDGWLNAIAEWVVTRKR
jgi:geranylgeranyl pyrophosphate synthase